MIPSAEILAAEILVIGAGMAGVACAQALAAAGQSVLVLDKGRGIGGRMATRRVSVDSGALRFDHGAQYLRPTDPAFRRALQDAGAQGWTDASDDRLIGAGGISAIPRAMAQGLNVQQQAQVTTVTRQGDVWQVAGLAAPLTAQRVVLTIPAPQISAVLGADHPLSQVVAPVTMAPCLTLMAAFAAGSPRPFAHRLDPDHPLAWIAQNSTKEPEQGGPVTWVAQASAAFSHTYLEDTPNMITARLLPLLCDVIGTDPAAAIYAQSHRWRYAQTARPLGQPFLRSDDHSLYLGGDWCLGAQAQDAFVSGRAIARDILGQRDVG